MTNIQADYLNI